MMLWTAVTTVPWFLEYIRAWEIRLRMIIQNQNISNNNHHYYQIFKINLLFNRSSTTSTQQPHNQPTNNMSSSSSKPVVLRSCGRGGAGNFVKATSTPSSFQGSILSSVKKSNWMMRGIGGAGNAISRSSIEEQRSASVSSERPASLYSVSSGRYRGIGGRGNWSSNEERRESTETDRSLL
jgi:hypothetical protein